MFLIKKSFFFTNSSSKYLLLCSTQILGNRSDSIVNFISFEFSLTTKGSSLKQGYFVCSKNK